MELKIERKRLYDACKKVLKSTGPKTSAPELSGILIEADADNKTLKLTGTDLTVTLMVKFKDVDISEAGTAVISAGTFTNMLGAMTAELAEITVQNNSLKLKCGSSVFSMATMDVDKYPNVNIAFPENTICVSGLALLSKQNISVISAANVNDNPSFQGVQVNFSPGISTAMSSDGIRFMRSKGTGIADGVLDLFIPDRALKLLCGVVKFCDELYIGQTNNNAIFMTNEFAFSTCLKNGDLNNIEKLMERVVPKYSAEVNSSELLRAVESAVLMTHNVDSCVNVTLTDASLVLSVDNENGEMIIEVDAEKSTDMAGLIFHYRPNFILDFLRSNTGLIMVEFSESGVMKLRSDVAEYIVSRRNPAIIKAKKAVKEMAEKVEKGTKTKKGKAAKNAA